MHDQVVEHIARTFADVSIGPALDDPGLGPLISSAQRDRVNSYVSGLGRDGEIRFGPIT